MHVAQLSTEDRTRRLRSSIAKNDRVRLHPNVAGVVFVSSETSPGIWHWASNDSCDCIGFQQRGMCRRAVRASWELHKAKKAAEAIAATGTDLPPAA